MGHLTERELKVLAEYAYGHTFKEVGEMIGVKGNRASTIFGAARRKLASLFRQGLANPEEQKVAAIMLGNKLLLPR